MLEDYHRPANKDFKSKSAHITRQRFKADDLLPSDYLMPCENNCGKYYSNYQEMMRHLRSDCGALRRFGCAICCKLFKRKYHLKRHYHIHSVNYDDIVDEERVSRQSLGATPASKGSIRHDPNVDFEEDDHDDDVVEEQMEEEEEEEEPGTYLLVEMENVDCDQFDETEIKVKKDRKKQHKKKGAC